MSGNDFDALLERLTMASTNPCIDLRHAGALRDAATALRALNDLSAHIMEPLRAPHQPTPCADPNHVELLRDAAKMLELSMTTIPDGLRYLAATTPDAASAVQSTRMRKLSDLMVENWRRSQPS